MPSLAEYERYVTMPEVQAALDTIAWAEGGQYNNQFGGGTFSGNQHPTACIPYGSTCSTAAGRYQFLLNTWNGIARALGLRDFGPHNQDIGAVYLIWQRGQLSNLLAGNFEAVCRGIGCLWAALPYNGRRCSPPQNERPLGATLNYYNSALAVYRQRAGQAPPVPTPTQDPATPVINAIAFAPVVDPSPALASGGFDYQTFFVVAGFGALALILFETSEG